MKHLVRHIDTAESVSTLFDGLTDSFVAEENPSVTRKMKPEYKIATKQRLCLNTPVVQDCSKAASLERVFFNLCRRGVFESWLCSWHIEGGPEFA